MTGFGHFFKAERIKCRKSWALLTAILAPICQIGFLFTMFWFSEAQVKHFGPGFRFWLEINFLAWNLLLMPIVIALVAELSWGLEEESHAWDHLFAQPVSRSIHFRVKLLSQFSLVFLSQVLLVLILVPVGLVLRVNPYLGMGHIPWSMVLGLSAFTFLASIPIVAFHTWLSTRLSGIGFALAITFIGTWFCVRLMGGSTLVQWAPWGLSSQMAVLLDRSKTLPWGFAIGGLLCAAFLVGFGAYDFTRRRGQRT